MPSNLYRSNRVRRQGNNEVYYAAWFYQLNKCNKSGIFPKDFICLGFSTQRGFYPSDSDLKQGKKSSFNQPHSVLIKNYPCIIDHIWHMVNLTNLFMNLNILLIRFNRTKTPKSYFPFGRMNLISLQAKIRICQSSSSHFSQQFC